MSEEKKRRKERTDPYSTKGAGAKTRKGETRQRGRQRGHNPNEGTTLPMAPCANRGRQAESTKADRQQTSRQTDNGQPDRWVNGERDKHKAPKQTNRQADKQTTGKQTNGQPEKEASREEREHGHTQPRTVTLAHVT